MLVFTVLGFGLLLTFYHQFAWTSFFITFFTVSCTILVAPLFQKLWFNIFTDSFNKENLTNLAKNSEILYKSQGSLIITVSYEEMKVSIMCAISQLVLYLGIIGKMPVYKVIFTSLLFNFAWNLNYFLCVFIVKLSPDNRFFDDYAINMVYLFAGVYGLVISADVPSYLKFVKINTK
jgi:hypothetical protein